MANKIFSENKWLKTKKKLLYTYEVNKLNFIFQINVS